MTPWIILISVIVIAAIAYFYFTGQTGTPSTSLITDTSSENDIVGSQVLGLLSQIQTLKIDKSFFDDPGFRTLIDYTVPVTQQNVGRQNPFAPIPGEQTKATAPASAPKK